jgi:hypothetical protein
MLDSFIIDQLERQRREEERQRQRPQPQLELELPYPYPLVPAEPVSEEETGIWSINLL